MRGCCVVRLKITKWVTELVLGILIISLCPSQHHSFYILPPNLMNHGCKILICKNNLRQLSKNKVLMKKSKFRALYRMGCLLIGILKNQ